MSLKRLGIAQPIPHTPTKLTDVNTNYFASVIITNVNETETANLTIYVKPHGVTASSEFAYVLYNFPLERANSLETNRFAMNPLDELWVESSIEFVSFVCEGLPQSIVNVRYTVGPTLNLPTSPLAGDQHYNTDTNQLLVYKPTGWKTVTTS